MFFSKSINNEVETLRDNFPHVGCGLCKYFNVRADFDEITSICKRLDHKTIRFYMPWFASYDCGQRGGVLCKDFLPSDLSPKLVELWTETDTYVGEIPEKETLALVLNKDKKVVFLVSMREFYDGSFITKDNKIRCVGTSYYKRSMKSPTGYELIRERYEVPVEIGIN